MDEIKYVLLSPNENITALILTKVSVEKRKHILKYLMRKNMFEVEQIGFLEDINSHEMSCKLQMSGDEFCSNAVASACAVLAYANNRGGDKPQECKVNLSGTIKAINCLTKYIGGNYIVRIPMPLPISVEKVKFPYEGLRYDVGILHFKDIINCVVCIDKLTVSVKRMAHKIMGMLLADKRFKLMGVTLYLKRLNKIIPLISVPGIGTEIWESSCGIATASAGIYRALDEQKSVEEVILQPSGYYIPAKIWFQQGIVTSVEIEVEVAVGKFGTLRL